MARFLVGYHLIIFGYPFFLLYTLVNIRHIYKMFYFTSPTFHSTAVDKFMTIGGAPVGHSYIYIYLSKCMRIRLYAGQDGTGRGKGARTLPARREEPPFYCWFIFRRLESNLTWKSLHFDSSLQCRFLYLSLSVRVARDHSSLNMLLFYLFIF